jgi:hypothetical protein
MYYSFSKIFELVSACSPTRVADLLDIATENSAHSYEVTFVRTPAILFFLCHPLGKRTAVSIKKSGALFLDLAWAPRWRITSAMSPARQAGRRGRSSQQQRQDHIDQWWRRN